MVDLKLQYAGAPGFTQVVTPGAQPLRDLNFAMLRLNPGESYAAASGADEVGVVILSGGADCRIGAATYTHLGQRATVFDGRATGAYIPVQTDFAITGGELGVEAAICRSHASIALPAQIIRPEQVVAREVGGSGYLRYVHDIIGTGNAQAQGLIIGETFTCAGNWSSFPPHKHDTLDLPTEAQQEELYLFKIRPANGFGIQYWYARPGNSYGALDQAAPVRENDVTLMPYGYHPVAAPPGYDVYYLWFMAGPAREMHPNEDPEHRWIRTDPPTTRTYPR